MSSGNSTLQELFARSTELRAEIELTLSQVGGKLSIAAQQRLSVHLSELESVSNVMRSLPKPSPVWIGRVQRVDEDLEEIKRTIDRLIGQRAREELLGNSRNQQTTDDAQTNALLRERSHLESAGSALDGLIAQGRSMFGGITNQNEMLKSGNRKLLDILNKSGVNVRLVQQIVGREHADALIVYACMFFTLLIFFLLYVYFRY